MQALHFSGLSEQFHVGPACLLPCSKLGGLLQPCCVCQKVTREYQLCDAGHSLCGDCVPSSETNKKWCVCCRKFANFTAISVPLNIIEQMEFACGCSFTGTLSEIKKHLLGTNTPESCFNRPAPGNDKRDERLCVRTGGSGSNLTPLLSEIIRLLKGNEVENGRLTDTIAEVQVMNFILCADRRVFLFKIVDLLHSECIEQHKIVAGVPLKLQVAVRDYDGKPFLGVYVGASMQNAEIFSWPLKKTIAVTLHNSQGKFLQTRRIPTFVDGAFTHRSFIHPNTTPATFGFAEFLAMDDLVRLYAQTEETDYLVFSVTLEEIDPDVTRSDLNKQAS